MRQYPSLLSLSWGQLARRVRIRFCSVSCSAASKSKNLQRTSKVGCRGTKSNEPMLIILNFGIPWFTQRKRHYWIFISSGIHYFFIRDRRIYEATWTPPGGCTSFPVIAWLVKEQGIVMDETLVGIICLLRVEKPVFLV